MPQETLEDIANQIEATGKTRNISVRQLLATIGRDRRGKNVSIFLRKQMKRYRLKCEPNFDEVYFDEEVTLSLSPKLGRPVIGVDEELLDNSEKDEEEVDSDEKEKIEALFGLKKIPNDQSEHLIVNLESKIVSPDTELSNLSNDIDEIFPEREIVITVRKGIPAAGKSPLTITRNEPTKRALTRMIDAGVSELVVMSGARSHVQGIFNWQSYGATVMANRKHDTVGDCLSMDFGQIKDSTPLFDAIREIIRYGTVAVRGKDDSVCGLVSHKDVADVFVDLAEPFLFLGQIENHIRELVERMKLSKDELKGLADARDEARAARVKRVDDLTLGELVRAIQKPDYWLKLNLDYDHPIVLKRLDRVNEIRNKVMHFDADPLKLDEKNYLLETLQFLQKL